MTGIRIVTDSTTDLPRELLEQYRVEVVPLTVYVDGATYLDSVTIQPIEFMHKMSVARELPKTSQPSIGSFAEVYDRLGADGSTVISIHMTSGMSGTYQAARAAAELSSSNVLVVDSRMISQALGFQVTEAARLAAEGASPDSILLRLQSVCERTRLYVVVDTLVNLIRGGRIGKAAGLIGTMLSIKPIAMLKEGVYSPIAKVRTTSQVVRTLMEHFREDTQHRVIRGIGISHADNLPLAARLKQALAEWTDVPVRICPATPVITTHTGPGAIGFMFYTE